jgi:hypothetical protein
VVPVVKGFRRASCLAAALFAASAAWTAAAAGDWSLRTNLTETLSLNDNLDFVPDPDGIVFGSYSRIGLTSQYRSHIDDFILNGGVGYQTYFGDAGDIPSDRFFPGVDASYVRSGKTNTFTLGASLDYAPATDTQNLIIPGLEVPGLEDAGDRVSISANMSVAHKINNRNDITFAARASKTDFINGASTDDPFVSLGSTLSWHRRLSKRVDYTFSSGLDWYDYDDAVNRERYYVVLRNGTQAKLTNRVSVTANLGATLTQTNTDASDSTTVGGIADAGFTYALKDGSIGGGVSYGLTPDDNGNFGNSLGFNAAISHTVNDLLSVRLGGQYRLSGNGVRSGLDNSTFSLSPSLSYTLARDWTLTANYQFAWTDDEDGNAVQNSVQLTLSRSYVLMP